jgi:hypothetical protein
MPTIETIVRQITGLVPSFETERFTDRRTGVADRAIVRLTLDTSWGPRNLQIGCCGRGAWFGSRPAFGSGT